MTAHVGNGFFLYHHLPDGFTPAGTGPGSGGFQEEGRVARETWVERARRRAARPVGGPGGAAGRAVLAGAGGARRAATLSPDATLLVEQFWLGPVALAWTGICWGLFRWSLRWEEGPDG